LNAVRFILIIVPIAAILLFFYFERTMEYVDARTEAARCLFMNAENHILKIYLQKKKEVNIKDWNNILNNELKADSCQLKFKINNHILYVKPDFEIKYFKIEDSGYSLVLLKGTNVIESQTYKFKAKSV